MGRPTVPAAGSATFAQRLTLSEAGETDWTGLLARPDQGARTGDMTWGHPLPTSSATKPVPNSPHLTINQSEV